MSEEKNNENSEASKSKLEQFKQNRNAYQALAAYQRNGGLLGPQSNQSNENTTKTDDETTSGTRPLCPFSHAR